MSIGQYNDDDDNDDHNDGDDDHNDDDDDHNDGDNFSDDARWASRGGEGVAEDES